MNHYGFIIQCNIKVQNKSVFYKQMYLKGFCMVCDLLDSDGNFLSFNCKEHNVKVPFTSYEGLRPSILRK